MARNEAYAPAKRSTHAEYAAFQLRRDAFLVTPSVENYLRYREARDLLDRPRPAPAAWPDGPPN
jgi:hypothetical protein